jgi:hypothetical protein
VTDVTCLPAAIEGGDSHAASGLGMIGTLCGFGSAFAGSRAARPSATEDRF